MADTSQGTGSQSQQGEGDAPKYVTEEQLNRAITARLKDFEKKVGETISKSVDGIAPSLDKLLDEKLQALKPADEGKGKQPDPKNVDIENHPAFKGLKKQLEEATSATGKLREERDTEAKKAKDVELRTKLSDALLKHGIDPKYARQAVGLLIDADKRAKWNDDGSSIVFRDERDGDVDLDTGLKGWVKGDEAKIYLPPRGTSGSGDRGGGRRPAGQQQGHERGALGRAILEYAGSGTSVTLGPGSETR